MRPRAIGQPAHLLEELDRAAAIELLAVGVLVRVLGEVRVEPDVEPSASSAVAVMSRRLTENGEHGARAIRTIAPSEGSW